MTKRGDCFEVALHLAYVRNGVVVHGLPLGQGGDAEGERYWHAWVEIEDFGVPIVLDKSNGLNVMMAAEKYYAIGKIERTWRFTFEEAAREMRDRGHYGPWVDDWETVCDNENEKPEVR